MTNLQNSADSDHLSDSVVDSSSSELERLEVEVESREGSPTERALVRTKKQEEQILGLIRQSDALGANNLDLSNKGLLQIPEELLELKTLEYLYLEGNELSYLPEDFFDKLPNLRWLDLRRNYLSRIPSLHIGRHQCLRNLLLEGNNLRTLPLELGSVRTLHGLNISNNPLEFPPADVIEKGTHDVLKFLQEMMQVKSAKFFNGDAFRFSGQDGSGSSDDEWDEELGDFPPMLHQQNLSREESKQSLDIDSDLIGPVPLSAELHRPVSYTEMKQLHLEKLKRAGAAGTVESSALKKHLLKRKSRSKKFLSAPAGYASLSKAQEDRKKSASSVISWKVNQYPEPPPPDYVDQRMAEERKIAKIKELKEKQDAILQRRKDEEMLKEWRDETKRLKQKKYSESLKKGTKDYIDPATLAPFAIEKEHLRIPTNEERIKEDVKTAHERIRRAVSPATRQRIEQEKAARIRELERRIKDHSAQMVERRKKPKGTPQEEMEAAKRELAVAEELHHQLLARREELEYRFRAFTADVATGFSKSTRLKN